MGTPLSILIVEDSDSDAGLMVRQLQKDGYEVVARRVDTAAAMRDALHTSTWDVVLSDFNVPGFGAGPALALLRELSIDLPFIVVSGVIGEQAAVQLMKAGAHDCVMKDQVGRLAPAVKREVDEARERHAHRLADQELRASEGRYRSLFENMLNGFAYCKMEYDEQDRPVDFVYLEVNRAFNQMTELHDVVGRHVSEVIPGIRALSPELFEIYGRVARSGVPETFEFDFKSLGKWLTVSVYSPAKGRFVAIFDDITARKKAELALLESEWKYRRIYDSLQDVFVEMDLNGTIIEISPKIKDLFHSQYLREELLGQRSESFYADPKGRDALMQTLKECGQLADYEIDLRNRDGSTVPCSLSATFSRNADGVPTGIVSTVRDISRRKHTERELAEANEQFRAVVEQSIAGSLIIQDRKIAYVNPRFCEILGYASPGELAGLDLLSLVVEEDRTALADTARRLLGGEVDRLSHTMTGLRKDGSTVTIGADSARATFRGRPAIIAIMQDISEKTRAEEQLQRYVAQLKSSFMSTVEVATTISEMRDPYTAGHERRVAEIAVAIGAELGFDDRRLEGLRVGGYLHDLGKITIPAEILSKPGKLKPVELKLIQGHPQASYDVLKNVEFPWPVAQMALQHHERLNGSGYPQGLSGEAILLEARILGVADTVEAMSSHRPYRAALGIDIALAEIERGRGSLYDPPVVDACLRLFRQKSYAIPA